MASIQRDNGRVGVNRQERIAMKIGRFLNAIRSMDFLKFYTPAFIKEPYKYLIGKGALDDFILEKKDNEICLVLSDSVGDNVYGLAYLDALHEFYPQKKILVIGYERYRTLLESYPQIDRLILIPDKTNQGERLKGLITHPKLVERAFSQGMIITTPYWHKRLRDAQNLDCLYQFRNDILSLPGEPDITYHRITKGTVSSIHDFDKIKDKVVIINPYSKSTPRTMQLYEFFCRALIERNYYVFTNVIGNQKSVRGSEPLRCSIYELYSIAYDIPLVVSVRSGILDFLVTSNVNMFAVYEIHNAVTEYHSKAYSLNSWKCGGKIEEVCIRKPSDIDSAQEKFISFLNELRK